MTRPDDGLRASLQQIADQATPVDLYERSLRRSRGIGRNRALAGTGAALVVLGLAGTGLWQLPVRLPGPTPAASVSATLASSQAPQSRSLSDVPGTLFYENGGAQVIELRPGGVPKPVLSLRHDVASVSPDGTRIAYLVDGQLWVAGATAKPSKIPANRVKATDAPVWTPDGTGLLVTSEAGELVVVDPATGDSVAPPVGMSGTFVRWSGDGRRYVTGDVRCRLQVTGTGSSSARNVPGLGVDAAAQSARIDSCRPISVDRTATRVAVSWKPDTGTADVTADAVVDTATGAFVGLPVRGTVTAALFGPDGSLLIRSTSGDRTVLSLLSPTNALLVQADEPAGLDGTDLIAYTG